jgi:hypothetical protein
MLIDENGVDHGFCIREFRVVRVKLQLTGFSTQREYCGEG